VQKTISSGMDSTFLVVVVCRTDEAKFMKHVFLCGLHKLSDVDLNRYVHGSLNT
jgi:hypothetical protein